MNALWVSRWEHQAGLLHAMSPTSMKLFQFKRSTQKLEKTNWFVIWIFQGGDRPPPRFITSHFYHISCFKLGKIYEAFSTIVFDLYIALRVYTRIDTSSVKSIFEHSHFFGSDATYNQHIKHVSFNFTYQTILPILDHSGRQTKMFKLRIREIHQGG